MKEERQRKRGRARERAGEREREREGDWSLAGGPDAVLCPSPLLGSIFIGKLALDISYTVKPDKLVQLKLFEETDCLELFKFTNSNKLSTSNYFM